MALLEVLELLVPVSLKGGILAKEGVAIQK